MTNIGYSNFPLSPTASPKCKQIFNTPTLLEGA